MNSPDAIVVGAGQSGLAAAHALRAHGLRPVVLEAGPEPVGSWPNYYDSLTLFSPARYSALLGLPFPGDPERYPHRDEVVEYLRRYAATRGCSAERGARAWPSAAAGEDRREMRFRVADGTGSALSWCPGWW